MKRGLFLKGLCCAFAMWLMLLPAVIHAQEPETRFFPETGRTVRGPFLQFFDEHGGLDVFGPPVSEELVEDGIRIQYFQNIRLELHPENPRPYRVQPGLLGDLQGQAQPPVPSAEIPLADNPTERYYPQTGHTIRQGFLAFFDYYGGLDLFGYPISEMVVEPGGRVTQWFQKAQLEWRPDEAGGEIRLTALGEMVYEQRYPNRLAEATVTLPTTEDVAIQAFGLDIGTPHPPGAMQLVTPGSLKVSVSVQNATTGGSNPGYQQVSVYVTDEHDMGVPNAAVQLTVSSLGRRHTITMPLTDRTGLTRMSFEISQVELGSKVVISALASYANQMTTTETSFLPWY